MKAQIGDLVQILDKWGVPEVDPYLVIGVWDDFGNLHCRNLATGTEWSCHWRHLRPLTKENIEEAHRIHGLEEKNKQNA